MGKKLFIGVLALALAAPAIGLAQTGSTTSATALIQQLQAQIQALQTQIANLRQAQQNVQTARQDVREAAGEVKDTVKLLRQLRQGMSGDDVTALQALLAADPEVYPEGLISGYYGRLTAEAVKRYQRKHGLSQVGNVGPQTLRRLQDQLQSQPLALDSSTSGGPHKICVPPGHLIAPGWIRKTGGVPQPVVNVCSGKIPEGIAKKLPGATTTPDTAAPIISNVLTSIIAVNTATVIWTTNEPSTTQVEFGTSSLYGFSSPFNGSLTTSHSAAITGLNASTTYHYRARSTDAAGNTATSGDFMFTTLAAPDTTAPVISNVSAGVASTTATVTWDTNESSDSKVYYSTSSPVDLATAPSASSSSMIVSHSVGLSGLNASTTYYYVVQSKDAANNTATSSQQSFTTLP